jgi:hypothetical protein
MFATAAAAAAAAACKRTNVVLQNVTAFQSFHALPQEYFGISI